MNTNHPSRFHYTLFIILITFFYLPKINSLDLTIIILFPIAFFILISKKITLKKEFIYIIIILSFIQSYVFLTSVINMEFTSNVVLNTIRSILILSSLYIVISYYQIKFQTLIHLLMFVFLLNSILIFIQFFLHLKFGFIDYIYNPEFPKNMINTVRKPGYFTGYPVAGFISNVGVLSSLYLYSKEKKISYVIYFILFLTTSLLTARTALLFNLLIIPFSLLILKKKHIISLFLILVPLIIFILLNSNDYITAIESKIRVVFDLIIEQKGDHSTNDLLKNHYRLPNDIKTFIIGNALNPQFFSDVGYIQVLFKGGLLLFLFTLFFYSYIFIVVINNTYHYKKEFIFSLSIIMCFIFYNFKGPYLLSRTVGDFILVIFIASILCKITSKHQDTKREKKS